MKIRAGILSGAAVAGALAAVQPAAATTASSSFGVSVTVTAACTLASSPWTAGPVCLRRSASTIQLAAAPVVRFSRDPQTGALVQTVEF